MVEKIYLYEHIGNDVELKKIITHKTNKDGLWCEMTRGEKKAFIIQNLVKLGLPSGEYSGLAIYQVDYTPDSHFSVKSEVIQFVRRGE